MVKLMALEDLAWDYIKFSYAPGSYSNMVMKRKWYTEFCIIFQLTPFPITQWQIIRFATYLSFWFTLVQSIKNYVSGICMLNELNGFDEVSCGALYGNVIRGIWRELRACTKQAAPLTRELLQKISEIIDVTDQCQLATWVVVLFGFNLFLRKSNLIPDTRQHEPQFEISRKDVRYHKGVMIIHIKWSKTDQFGSNPLYLPMVINKHSDICPVKWCLYMLDKIPANMQHNLFSYRQGQAVLPITYSELTSQLHEWLRIVRVKNPMAFSSHSMR